MRHWLPNAIAYQLVWFATVGGAGYGWWWAGPVAFVVFAAWQLPRSGALRSDLLRADVLLCVAAAVAGAVVDSIWAGTGLMRYASPLPSSQFAPVWIVTLWMSFALTFNHSLAMLKPRLLLAAGLGACGGPLAYAISGRAWEAVDLGVRFGPALLALAIAWAIVLPLLFLLARRLAPTTGVTPS